MRWPLSDGRRDGWGASMRPHGARAWPSVRVRAPIMDTRGREQRPSSIICAVPKGHLPRATKRAGVAHLGFSEFGHSNSSGSRVSDSTFT